MKKVVTFNGIRFVCYPDSKSRSGRRYYYPDKSLRAKGIGSLHQEVWKFHNGPIPRGMEIHHKDENTDNNDISNLECLTRKEHANRHGGATPEKIRTINYARQFAPAWHRSDAGREWHSVNAKRAWEKRTPLTKPCAMCGQEFDDWSRRDNSIYCSITCRQKHHYKNKVGWRKGQCIVCRGEFYAQQGKQNRPTCSKSCAAKYRWQRRKQGD